MLLSGNLMIMGFTIIHNATKETINLTLMILVCLEMKKIQQALYSEGVPFSLAGLTLSGAKHTSGTNVLPRIQMFCT